MSFVIGSGGSTTEGTPKVAYRGLVPQFGTTTPLYTVPGSTTAILKNITLSSSVNGAAATALRSTTFASAYTSYATQGQVPCVDCTPDGTIYFHDGINFSIQKIDTLGNVSSFVGTGSSGFADNTGPLAGFNNIHDLCIDSTGTNMYVADTSRIRKVVLSTGVVTTIAGTGTQGQTANATGTSATVSSCSMCISPDDSTLYLVPVIGNGGFTAIQKVTLTGTFAVATVVASAIANNTTSAVVPNKIAVNAAGTQLYFSDWNSTVGSNTNHVRTVTTAGAGLTIFSTIQTYTVGQSPVLATNWQDANMLIYPTDSFNMVPVKIGINGVVGHTSIPIIASNGSTFGVGSTDGPYGVGQIQAAIIAMRVRNGYGVMIGDCTATANQAIYRVNIKDGFIQRVFGGAVTPGFTFSGAVNYDGKCLGNSASYVKIWIVPSGQSLGDAYLLAKYIKVNPGEILSMDLNEVLATGDTVYAEAVTPGTNIAISVGEVT